MGRRGGRDFGQAARLWGGLALLAAVGCGSQKTYGPLTTYEVRSQVLKADGKPLTAGRVVFVPEDEVGSPAVGEIGPDGSFSLTTKEPGDGAVPGRYKVKIEPDVPAGKAKAKLPFPKKYIDEDASGLVLTVEAQPNTLEPIRLK